MKPAFAEHRRKGGRLDRTVSAGACRCPVAGCGAPLRDGHLMCRAHWSMVPADLRCDIPEAFRRWRRHVDRRGDITLIFGARAQYQVLVEDAVVAVNARLTPDKGADR